MFRCTIVLVLLTASSILLGCAQSDGPGTRNAILVAQRPEKLEKPAPAAGDEAPPRVARKIVYSCQIDLEVDNINIAIQNLTALIESIQDEGGFLAKQELGSTSQSHGRSLWIIRVPLSQFNRFVSDVEQLGQLNRNSRDAQDVTEAYADLEARLRNKQSSEQRLLSHLEHSAQLKDTLELERELTRVRGEVEQLQGQLNLLKNKSDLATVTVTMTERHEITPAITPTFPTLVRRTFESSWNCLVACAKFVTLIVVAAAPWGITMGLLSIPYWLIRRHQKVNTQPIA